MGLSFDKSWPETRKGKSNTELGEAMQDLFGHKAATRFGDLQEALVFMEQTGGISKTDAKLILHSGLMEDATFLKSVDEVVQHHKGYDQSQMENKGLVRGIKGIVSQARLDWYSDNDFSSDTPYADLEAELTRQGRDRAENMKADKPFELKDVDVKDADVNRDEHDRPVLNFDNSDMDDDAN